MNQSSLFIDFASRWRRRSLSGKIFVTAETRDPSSGWTMDRRITSPCCRSSTSWPAAQVSGFAQADDDDGDNDDDGDDDDDDDHDKNIDHDDDDDNS